MATSIKIGNAGQSSYEVSDDLHVVNLKVILLLACEATHHLEKRPIFKAQLGKGPHASYQPLKAKVLCIYKHQICKQLSQEGILQDQLGK